MADLPPIDFVEGQVPLPSSVAPEWMEYLRLVSAGVSQESAAVLVLEQRLRRVYEQNLALARRSHQITARARSAKPWPA